MSDSDCSRPDSRTFWPCMNVYHAPCRKNDEYARKLKRENAMMRKYIRDNHSDLCVCINCWKIHAKMPDLFRDGKRDK